MNKPSPKRRSAANATGANEKLNIIFESPRALANNRVIVPSRRIGQYTHADRQRPAGGFKAKSINEANAIVERAAKALPITAVISGENIWIATPTTKLIEISQLEAPRQACLRAAASLGWKCFIPKYSANAPTTNNACP
jgi:hypothetical protein